ncbi:hypothetical protein HYPSUDRAFT_63321 [Hypholoma sublateritium FD-334 SS-4]|uniref:Uncharacterized protein n=1 Tax=Hypholoma sublateritium (strain FD-334 SS-4) TaxID=945553 RepID=A0A0D2PEQ0_HYPSF|nr:hypothetical protein HYPSUDRAFT_63321 [Hypholoma sublateritium FD-334 SS-4]
MALKRCAGFRAAQAQGALRACVRARTRAHFLWGAAAAIYPLPNAPHVPPRAGPSTNAIRNSPAQHTPKAQRNVPRAPRVTLPPGASTIRLWR